MFHSLRRILAPLAEFRKILSFHLFFRVGTFITALISAQSLGVITNLAISGASLQTMIHAAIPFLISILVNVALLIPHIRISTASIIRNKILLSVEKKTLDTLLHADDAIAVQAGIGKRVSIIQNGHSSWSGYTMSFLDVLISIVFLAGSIAFLVVKNPIIIPFVGTYMLIVFLFVRSNQKKIHPLRQDRRKLAEEYNRKYIRAIMEKLSVMLLGAIQKEEASRQDMGNMYLEKVRSIELCSAPGFWIPRFLLDFVRISTILTIGYFITQGKADAGYIVSFGIVFSMIDGNFQRILDSYQNMEDQSVQMNRLFEYLDSLHPLVRLREWLAFLPKKGSIELQNVSFSYPEWKQQVIKNLSLSLEGGKKTALVGRSGAGKSTIVKLILGLMLPDSGKIEIDGQSIADIRLNSYFPHIGYLSQEPSVFDGTIRENLSYGMQISPSDAELFKALKHARADFVQHYENGLETEIGERGIRLSGGERQRLAIARVFLRNPTILILDEPTSALDSFSEKAVTDALHELFQDKTVIVVAHRLQTVKEADMIYVLGEEWIIESGTHEILLTKNGEYAKMVDLQSGRVKEE